MLKVSQQPAPTKPSPEPAAAPPAPPNPPAPPTTDTLPSGDDFRGDNLAIGEPVRDDGNLLVALRALLRLLILFPQAGLFLLGLALVALGRTLMSIGRIGWSKRAATESKPPSAPPEWPSDRT